MSEDFADFYYRHPFQDDQRYSGSYSSAYGAAADLSTTFSAADHSSADNSLQMFDPAYVSFSQFMQGSGDQQSSFSVSAAFGLSPPSSSAVEEQPAAAEAAPATPNSSISSSSAEAAAGDEDSNKGKKGVKETLEDAEDDESSKKE